MWVLLVGPIPDGYHIDHLCHNEPCVNPDHLQPVTPRTNNYRSNIWRHRTHCPRGHAYNQANTGWTKNRPARYCKECNRLKHARRRAEGKE